MYRMLVLVHLVGLGLSLGAAAVKVSLLVGCRRDGRLAAAYVRVAPAVTRLLVSGLVLLTGSGIAFLALGRPFTPSLVAKIALVVAVWVIGPVIDRVVEPAFVRAAPADGMAAAAPADYARAHGRYLALELVATGLMGAITVLGVLV